MILGQQHGGEHSHFGPPLMELDNDDATVLTFKLLSRPPSSTSEREPLVRALIQAVEGAPGQRLSSERTIGRVLMWCLWIDAHLSVP